MTITFGVVSSDAVTGVKLNNNVMINKVANSLRPKIFFNQDTPFESFYCGGTGAGALSRENVSDEIDMVIILKLSSLVPVKLPLGQGDRALVPKDVRDVIDMVTFLILGQGTSPPVPFVLF